jgi:O-antigen/teichoic acid export membrane protein
MIYRNDEMSGMNLARGAARGAAWNFATVLFERGFGFVILGVLLRYIPASAVGVVAIGSAITDMAKMLALGGAGEQVQAAPGDKGVEAGAFWSQLLASLLFIAMLLAFAPAISRLYRAPALTLVLQALALNIFLTCFLVVPAARLANEFRFRALGLLAFGSTVSGGLAALPLALTGHGIEALIAQRLVGGAFFAVLICWVTRWVPPRPPSLAVLRKAFGFSLPLMQAALVDYFSITGYVMLIGLRMPAAAVGQFRIAQRLIEVLQEIAFAPARKVFLPVFVAVRMDPDRRFDMTRTMLDALSVFIFFAAAVAGAAAKPIVLLMFGPRWTAAVPVFSIITVMAPVTAFYGVINPLLTAADRPKLVSHFALGNVAIILAAVWFAAPFGLTPLAWALAARGLLSILFFIPALKIGLERPVMPLLRLLLLPFAALLAARGLAFLCLAFLPSINLFTQLCVSAGVAALAFIAVLLLAAPGRMVTMATQLHKALLGRLPVEPPVLPSSLG